MTDNEEEGFWYFLAAHFGFVDVDELKAKITYRQFRLWMYRWQVSPFGPRWDDWRMAAMSARLAQPWSKKTQRIEEHLAFKCKLKRAQTPEEIMSVFRFAAQRARECEKRTG